MIKTFFDILGGIFGAVKFLIYPVIAVAVLFYLLVGAWCIYYRLKGKKPKGRPNKPPKHTNILYQLLVLVPKRYVNDMFDREPDTFCVNGIHMFCGEQGSGKTMACTEMILRLQKTYPKSKTITNFGYAAEDDELNDWHQLLDYNNEHRGVIVGIDEIQNWFMAGNNKLPEGMLEVATQNRKNRRVICCTAQVFTRVNKGLREQVKMLYEPHTFLGCFTIVFKRKPVFDSEGNVTERKYRGVYAFVHTAELRNAYDTYKVIHTLSKEGFKEQAPSSTTNIYVAK